MKKHFKLGVMVIASLMITSNAFAAYQDYHARNMFNRMTDWSATMGKTAEDKAQIIDRRTEMRAKEREARAHKNYQDVKTDMTYQNNVDNLNMDNVKAKIDTNRKMAFDRWQIKTDRARAELNQGKDELRRKIDAMKDEEKRNYDIHVADMRAQYLNNPDVMNNRLKDVENKHIIKMKDLENDWNVKAADWKVKEADLKAKLDRENSDINRHYEMEKAQVK